MKTILFLLLFAFSASFAQAQNIYTVDSMNTVVVQQYTVFQGDTLTRNANMAAIYLHHGASTLIVALQDAPLSLLRDIRGVNLPNMAAAARTGKIDSVAEGTISMVTPSGDSLTSPTYFIHFASNKSFSIIGDGRETFEGLFPVGTVVAYIKQ